jgi:hypothetical protein
MKESNYKYFAIIFGLLMVIVLIFSYWYSLYSSKSYHSNEIEANKKALAIGYEINIRKSPNLNSQVLVQLKTGDFVDVLEVSKNIVDINIENKKYDYLWIKVKINNIIGWACNAFFTQIYILNQDKDFLAWAELISNEGAINPYLIVSYDLKLKTKIKTFPTDASHIYFSDLGNYYAIDRGTYIYGDLDIGVLPSCNIILKLGHDRSKIIWHNDSFIFKTTSSKNKDNDENNYSLIEYIFKDGKVFPKEIK